jgi:hypothetical protein
VAVNSLVLPNLAELENALKQIRDLSTSGGTFPGCVAGYRRDTVSLDATDGSSGEADYRTIKPAIWPRKTAEHSLYDFAFGGFRYLGLEQHFWQPLRYVIAYDEQDFGGL